jgi:hypothetical protein
MSGQFQHPEHGLVTRRWAVTDDYGTPLLFASRRKAEEYEASMSSPYKGIAYYNVLSYGQFSGSPARAVWVSANKKRSPA